MSRSKSTLIKLVVGLLFSTMSLQGQNKTIEHRVQKGENVYRLSLRYNVTINDIYELNPQAKELIRIGEILLIPVKPPSKSPDGSNTDNNYYTVNKGETKFGLSKKFGISIAQLEEANPFIKSGLQAGHRLKVPSSNNPTTSTDASKISHKVLKGETLWGISRRYNFSLEELKTLNKNVLGSVLLEGQVLTVIDRQNIAPDNAYTVKRGDTKFGLAKKFNTTISELERLNPSIVKMLMAGDVITYGKSDLKSQSKNDSALVEANINPEPKPTGNISSSTYKWYIIKPKETLFSLSKKSNMSISDLTTLNPILKQGVFAGDSIKIPAPQLTKLDATRSIPKLENKLQTKIFWQKSSLQAGSEQLQAISDYFKGVQNAIDSIAKNQPRMDVSIKLVSKTDSTFNNEVLENAETYLIKPLPNFNTDSLELSSFEFRFLENGVPKSIYVKALPSKAQMRMKMLSFIKSKNANTICLYDDNNSYNVPNIESVIPDITLIKLNRNGTFKPNELRNALDIKKKNYVIIESDKIGVFLSASTILLKELSNFDIQLAVLNQRNIPEESQVSVNRFKILKLIYPMVYNPNFIDKNEITQQIGFMINYDILKRISLQEANAFEKGETEVLGTHFNYILNGNVSENNAVSIYMYSENSTAILLETF